MDPLMLMIFGGMAGLSALFWIFVALVVRLGYRSTPRFSLGMAGASVLVVIGCVAAMPPGYDQAERDRVDALHAEFAPALERYRQAHSVYPPTLKAAGIPTPRTRYGPLQYGARMEDGASVYTISFGDYFENGFATWWDSRTRKWYLDT